MTQTSPTAGSKQPSFSAKAATASSSQLSGEAQEFVNTLQSLIQQIERKPDIFTHINTASFKQKVTETPAELVEKEIKKGKSQIIGVPGFLQTDGTPNWRRLASSKWAFVRYATATAAPLAPFMRSMPWLAAIPATIGTYRYIAQKLANNQLEYGIRKFGPGSMKGDFKYDKLMQGEANRNVQQQALEIFSHQAKNAKG